MTLVEGDPKAPFSIATTSMCRVGRYSFPRLLHFPLDSYFIMLSVKQGGIKYHFLSLWYDSTKDWTPVSYTMAEQSTHKANGPLTVICKLIIRIGSNFDTYHLKVSTL